MKRTTPVRKAAVREPAPAYPAKAKHPSKQSSGKPARAPHELIRAVSRGLDFAELETLREQLGLTLEQLAEKLGIARATLHRRKLFGRLSPEESDKVVRFARLLHRASKVFDGADRARQWLAFPQYALGGEIPLDYARTEVGAHEVENLLGCIEYGVYT